MYSIMGSIVRYTCEALAGAVVNCIIENGEPWFKASDVARALKYKDTDQAVRMHVSDEDTRQQGSFILNTLNLRGFRAIAKNIEFDEDESDQGLNPVNFTGLKGNWKTAKYINESGLYCLIFGSDMAEAKVFKHWVTREVLPQIRKTGSYNKDYNYWRNVLELGATSQQRWKEVKRLAQGREDELHYRVVEHIKKRYPDATINAGIGEHLTTDHARMDAYLKGYAGGQPDIIVIRGLPNGFQDVLAIELKNPNKKGKLSQKQAEYIDDLEINCKAKVIVSSDYDNIIIQVHDHYDKVFAIAQPPTPKTHDFATNENAKYWCNKLKNQTAFDEECEKRGISKHDVRIMTKREIASVLITFDKKRKSE